MLMFKPTASMFRFDESVERYISYRQARICH